MKKTLVYSIALAVSSMLVNAEKFPKLDEALPKKIDIRAQVPVFDMDKDSCYPEAGISRTGKKNAGLKTSGSQTGGCRNHNFENTSNTLHRYACKSHNGTEYCGHFYALYFEKDQIAAGPQAHRHDWEYVAIWTKGGDISHASYSAHGNLITSPKDRLPKLPGTNHVKFVYHQEGGLSHAMRFARDNETSAENVTGNWVTPTITSWYELKGDGVAKSRMRYLLNTHNYGKATIPLKDDNFQKNLNKFKPPGYPYFTSVDIEKSGYATNIGEGCETTYWFSEEKPNLAICGGDRVVWGMECSGDYCDNKRLICCKMSGVNPGPGSWEAGYWFSEEGTNLWYSYDSALVGVKCRGKYCDELKLILRSTPHNSAGDWTPKFSDERGYRYCRRGRYVSGLECTGSYCDSLSLYCRDK